MWEPCREFPAPRSQRPAGPVRLGRGRSRECTPDPPQLRRVLCSPTPRAGAIPGCLRDEDSTRSRTVHRRDSFTRTRTSVFATTLRSPGRGRSQMSRPIIGTTAQIPRCRMEAGWIATGSWGIQHQGGPMASKSAPATCPLVPLTEAQSEPAGHRCRSRRLASELGHHEAGARRPVRLSSSLFLMRCARSSIRPAALRCRRLSPRLLQRPRLVPPQAAELGRGLDLQYRTGRRPVVRREA